VLPICVCRTANRCNSTTTTALGLSSILSRAEHF
jgi:hypothetical protein